LATLSVQHLIGNLTKNGRFYSDQNTKQLTDHETIQCEATFSRFIYKQERSKCLLNYWCCWPFQLPLWYFHRDKNIEGLIAGSSNRTHCQNLIFLEIRASPAQKTLSTPPESPDLTPSTRNFVTEFGATLLGTTPIPNLDFEGVKICDFKIEMRIGS
jgi:hypothetical protein